MAEEGWRVNARGRRVPSRVTSNMRAFTGEKPEGGRDKAGRRYNRADGGTGRRVSVTSSGNRSVRVKSTRKNPGVGPTGGTRTSAEDRPSNVERRGKGKSPITSSRTRSVRVKQATDKRRTVGGDGQREFKTGPSRVTRGKGGYAGYRYVKPGSNNPIRKVDAPDQSSRRRGLLSGPGRTTSPNDTGARRTGPNRVTGGARIGKPISGAKSTSSGPNNTGARRTGGGKTPTKGAGQSRTTGYAKKNFWSGETPEVRKARVEKLHNAMRQGKAWGKYMNPRAKQLIKMGASLAGGGKGRLVKALLRELGFASLEKFKQMRDEGRNKEKKPVANLPADYKKTEKKEFKKAKQAKRRTKRLVKKR